MALKSSFAVVLRALRIKRHITQRDFADTTSRTYLSKLESGKSSITLDKLEQLSERLELSPLALLALTVSEETGEPAVRLVAKLHDEIRALAKDGGLPGLKALTAVPELPHRQPSSIRAPGQPTGRLAKAAEAGQVELPL
ncbi:MULTISPECIES: helix-turn-helix domain-containing protein [Pseudomonas]|uniref:helix-turn-helix domain-containing protein n=1 Tax=Pseudomonas TaxID=286 RepID=UPI00257A88F0|nr:MULTISPECIES: helix-turn-helix transcriptional regulator [Pseudomonas]